jgi:hypothetical protein
VPDFFNLKSPAANILKIADSLVHGDRGVSYGHPEDDFSCVAAIATAMLRRQGKLAGNEVISAEDWALFMVACKITRECYQHKIDNLVDGAGYFETLQMIHERRAGRS